MAAIRISAMVVAGLFASGPAFAGPFVEGDVGFVVPVQDDDYQDDVDESIKLGLRVGTATKFGAIDLGFDFTPYNDNLTNAFITDVDIQRYRFQIGARINHQLTPKAHLFVRFAAGLDLIHYSARGNFIVPFEASETDLGIALEASAGVLWNVGKIQLGAKLGVPMGFHFNEDDPDDQEDADLAYTAVDIDLAFVVKIPF